MCDKLKETKLVAAMIWDDTYRFEGLITLITFIL